MKTQKLTYQKSGVDIREANRFVESIKPWIKETARPGVVEGLGGFAGLFDLSKTGLKEPILLAASDGVGTKLLLAREAGYLEGIGQDLVAMCVNDLLVYGGVPLFFMDYYACEKLEQHQASTIIQSIAKACKQVGCALLGGETAEMPGLYKKGDFDLAGFALGAVERDLLLGQHKVQPRDQLIGLASSGVHSNGFSMIRAIIKKSGLAIDAPCPFDASKNLTQVLLEPTLLYVDAIHKMIDLGGVHACAHITGGGFRENLIRSIPSFCDAHIQAKAWQKPQIFEWLQQTGCVDADEMYTIFNCGIGMIVMVDENKTEKQLSMLRENHIAAFHIGEVTKSVSDQHAVFLNQ
ncbi:MAG: phosphoribosylformylglycinamidine cyclo-ligase [Pseudomonadota bacterium]